MKFSSPAFEDNQMIPATYTCVGENYSPPLRIKEVPENAKCLAIIVDDPDAPNGNFTHWMIWNINPKTENIEENSAPGSGAIEGMNGGGSIGYMGPCPPSGVHHYRFKVYALSSLLDVSQNISKDELEKVIQHDLIEKDEFIGLFTEENGS